MADPLPAWLEGLTHNNFFKCSPEMWADLDWSRAYMDMGPSPVGNLGPYWHVPRPSDGTQHRLYPNVLRSKWLLVIRRACEEAAAGKSLEQALSAEIERRRAAEAVARAAAAFDAYLPDECDGPERTELRAALAAWVALRDGAANG